MTLRTELHIAWIRWRITRIDLAIKRLYEEYKCRTRELKTRKIPDSQREAMRGKIGREIGRREQRLNEKWHALQNTLFELVPGARVRNVLYGSKP